MLKKVLFWAKYFLSTRKVLFLVKYFLSTLKSTFLDFLFSVTFLSVLAWESVSPCFEAGVVKFVSYIGCPLFSVLTVCPRMCVLDSLSSTFCPGLTVLDCRSLTVGPWLSVLGCRFSRLSVLDCIVSTVSPWLSCQSYNESYTDLPSVQPKFVYQNCPQCTVLNCSPRLNTCLCPRQSCTISMICRCYVFGVWLCPA